MIHSAFAAEHIPRRSCVPEIFNDLNQEINNKFLRGYNTKLCTVPFLNRKTAASLEFFSNFHLVLFRLLYTGKKQNYLNTKQCSPVLVNVCIFMWCLTACLSLAISIFVFCMASRLKESFANSCSPSLVRIVLFNFHESLAVLSDISQQFVRRFRYA